MDRSQFRFEDFEIWKLSLEIVDELFEIADRLEKKRYYRWAEQLRGAGMSMPNNIAEGSGSFYNNEFKKFLDYARKSCFECANIIFLLNRKLLVDLSEKK